MVAISGAKLARQAVRGDASSCNEKSGNLDLCLLVEGVLFRSLAIRRDVFPGHRGCDTPGSQKAPSAKRCIKTAIALLPVPPVTVRKHRAPKGALKPSTCLSLARSLICQKAPSAKRYIKTVPSASWTTDEQGSESTERQKVH